MQVCTTLTPNDKTLFYNATMPMRPTIEVIQRGLTLPGVKPYTDLVTFVPPLAITLAPAPGVCGATDSLTFRGQWFVKYDNVQPRVALQGAADVAPNQVTLTGCSMAPGPLGKPLETCTTLSVVVGALSVPRRLSILNPAPMRCNYTLPSNVVFVPAPPVVTPNQQASICLGGTALERRGNRAIFFP